MATVGSSAEQTAARHRFDVSEGPAVETLRAFSSQSGEQILYVIDDVREVGTRAIRGEYTARQALEAMLESTGLVVVHDVRTRALVVRRADEGGHRDLAERKTPPRERRSQQRQRSSADAPTDEIVTLSSFEVRSRGDRGYKAANSVSATRMAVPIRQLPMGISAFTEEFIAEQHAYDLFDVLKWAPGVSQDNISPQGWARYNVRGFTYAAVQRNGFGSFRFVDTTNVARVEVVKGPASLFYGQINPGGVINYITKRPEEAPGVALSAGVGSHGHHRVVVDATGPIPGSRGRLLYRLVGMRENIQQFQDFARGEKRMLAPSVTWKFSDLSTLTIDYEHFARDDDMPTSGVVMRFVDGVAVGPYPGLSRSFSYAGESDYQNFRSDVLSADFRSRLGERWDVQVAYVHAWWDMEWRATGQGATGLIGQSFIDHYHPKSSGLAPADAMFRRNRWEHHWGTECTAQADVVGRFSAGPFELRPLAGYRRNFDTRTGNVQRNNPNVAGDPRYLAPWDLRNPSTWSRAVPFGVDALLPTVDARASSNAASWYGVLSASGWNDRVHLLGGFARHVLHNEAALDNITGQAASPSKRSANVPQAGALLQVTPAFALFGSYSESFLANASMLRVNNVPAIPAAPSVGRGTEAGVKLELWDGRVSGTISTYRIRASPAAITSATTGVAPDGTTLISDIQGGSQLSEGVELDLLLTLSPTFQVLVGYSRSDAVYEKHPTEPALDGSRLVATPEWTFDVWGRYTIPDGWWRGLSIGAGVARVGRSTYVTNNPAVLLADHTTLDVSLRWPFKAFGRQWRADLIVKNVTNRQYYASATSWGFPRHGMVTLNTRF